MSGAKILGVVLIVAFFALLLYPAAKRGELLVALKDLGLSAAMVGILYVGFYLLINGAT